MKSSEMLKDLRELSAVELESKQTDLKQEAFNLRFQHATRQLDNTARLGQVRREIARVKTVLREKLLANG